MINRTAIFASALLVFWASVVAAAEVSQGQMQTGALVGSAAAAASQKKPANSAANKAADSDEDRD